MNKIKDTINEIDKFCGKEVTIRGWLRNKRVSKNVSFLMINDGTDFSTIQIVYKGLYNQEEIDKQLVGSAVEVTGEVVLTTKGDSLFEIKATSIIVIGTSSEDYPIQPKKHSFEFLREKPHLRIRTNTFNAVFKIRSILAKEMHNFYDENDFVYIHTPIITESDSEGAGEMFRITTLNPEVNNVDASEDFFGKSVNLTVTGQLHVEPFTQTFQKVYTFGPTFRAENSNTTRHAAEFWMIEPEMAFHDLNDCVNVIENNLKYVIGKTLSRAKKELDFLNTLVDYDLVQRLETFVNNDIPRITYTSAIDILLTAMENGKKFENNVEWGIDLSSEHEKFLTDEHFQSAIFITDYPRDFKAFYMRLNDDQKTVAATDLLIPGIGELAGGSQREERIEILKELIISHDLPVEEYEWYLELRKFGGVVHSGYGLGFERLIMYVTGMENIRDVVAYPRTTKNCNL